jgi:7-cyano-7-deazaguanine synthase
MTKVMTAGTQAYKTPSLIAVLLSGGADSATVLFMANQISEDHEIPLHTISFNYGQRHEKEIEAAGWLSDELSANHHIIDLSEVIPPTMLTGEGEVPNVSYSDIEGVSPMYVPFRNGLMLSAATAYVDGLLGKDNGHAHLYCGIHSDDAAGYAYPDCTSEFFGSMANAIFTGSYGRTRLIAPALWMTKANIVSVGEELGVPWHETWSCYKGGDLHCGQCATCRARKEAFETAGIEDPTEYLA